MSMSMDAWCEALSFPAYALHKIAALTTRADFVEFYIVALVVPVVLLLWIGPKQPAREGGADSKEEEEEEEEEKERKEQKEEDEHERVLGGNGVEKDTLASPEYRGWFIGMEALPVEVQAEVSKSLKLSDLVATGMTCRQAAEAGSLWSSPEVWHARARHCELNLCADACHGDVASLRDQFRKAMFRTDGAGLLAIFATPPPLGDFKPLFAEAAHVLRGLVRADGALPAQYLVELLRPALRGFDAMDDDTVALADDMLEVARRRRDVLSEAQVQLLEEANDHAEQLAHLLHSAMQEHEAQLDTQFNEMQLDALEADACLETVPPLSSDETGLT